MRTLILHPLLNYLSVCATHMNVKKYQTHTHPARGKCYIAHALKEFFRKRARNCNSTHASVSLKS